MSQLLAERKRETPGRHLDDPGSNPKLILSTLFITQCCHCRTSNDAYIRCFRGDVIESRNLSLITYVFRFYRSVFISNMLERNSIKNNET